MTYNMSMLLHLFSNELWGGGGGGGGGGRGGAMNHIPLLFCKSVSWHFVLKLFLILQNRTRALWASNLGVGLN